MLCEFIAVKCITFLVLPVHCCSANSNILAISFWSYLSSAKSTHTNIWSLEKHSFCQERNNYRLITWEDIGNIQTGGTQFSILPTWRRQLGSLHSKWRGWESSRVQLTALGLAGMASWKDMHFSLLQETSEAGIPEVIE